MGKIIFFIINFKKVQQSNVYFIKLKEIEKIKELLPEFKGKVGVKVHFGEKGNISFVSAKSIKPIVEMIDSPTLIETSVLYRSPRGEASTHKKLALEHGFDFAPIDFLDGEKGDDSIEVKINGDHFKVCHIGAGLEKYNSLLVISHFKGHHMAGFGGAIKNLAMGFGSRRGKLDQHALLKHQVVQENCIGCKLCIDNCPVDAIDFNEKNKKANINQEKCIGCSKCMAICPKNTIQLPWDKIENNKKGNQILQERIAEYALAASKNHNCFYINFLANIVPNCDCIGEKMKNMTKDIGILLSNDPVAIDQASFDLVAKQCDEFREKCSAEYQLKQAEKLNLGNIKYKIIKI